MIVRKDIMKFTFEMYGYQLLLPDIETSLRLISCKLIQIRQQGVFESDRYPKRCVCIINDTKRDQCASFEHLYN